MLRKIRLTLAVVFFAIITLLFLDFTGTIHAWFGWMAKIQFLPAVLALNVGIIVLLILLTLVFGRVYCSVICPMGGISGCDIVAKWTKKEKEIPLLLLACQKHFALHGTDAFCYRCNCGNRLIRSLACTV